MDVAFASQAEKKKNSASSEAVSVDGTDAQRALGATEGIPLFLQLSSLALGEPRDRYEEEADLVAQSVVNGTIQRACSGCAGGEPCDECAEREEGIQRKSLPTVPESPGREAPPSVTSVVEDVSGQPLNASVQGRMEQSFGTDFSSVRVHTGSAVSSAAEELKAGAFTVGQKIFFGEGRYQPGTQAGDRLLAHELTHTLQQGGGASRHIVHRAPESIQRNGAPPAPPPALAAPSPNPPVVSDAGPLRPNSDFYFFRGVMMTTDEAFMMGELRRLIHRLGLLGGDLWFDALQGRGFDTPLPFSAHTGAYGGLRPRTPLDAQREMQEEERSNKLAPIAVPLAKQCYPKVHKEATDFLEQTFPSEMRATRDIVLKESETRLDAERVRYGLTRKGEPGSGAQYEADNTVAFQGLVGAAKDLLEKRKPIEELRSEQQALMIDSPDTGPYLPEMNRAKYEELGRKIVPLEQEYDHARTAAALRHPVLGAILDDDAMLSATERLKRLANGQLKSGPQGVFLGPTGTAGMIGQILDSRQESINKVRDKTNDAPEKLWSIDSIVRLTRARINTSSITMADRLIDDKLADLKRDEQLLGIFLGVAALVLAIPTGGGSLAVAAAVGTAAISGYQAFESIQKYQLEKALANTDLDKRAAALAAEDPSVFWVALDVAFAVMDGAAALKAFRAVKGEARAALLAKEGAEAIETEERLIKAADAAEGTQKSALGQRLRATLARLRGRPATVRALGDVGKAEAEAIAHAAEGIAKEAHSAETLVNVGGHEVKATRSGHIVVCTDCTWLRERFSRELAENPKLLERVQAAEDKVKKAAGGAVDASTKSEISALSQELHKAQEARLLAEVGEEGLRAIKIGRIKELFPKLQKLDDAALVRVLELAPHEAHVKGQLLEELLNARMASPEAIAEHVPADVAKRLSKEGKKLEFIPGHAIRDAEGAMISDGVIGYWKDDKFEVVTFFESKAGSASGRGLRRKWTGIPKVERAEVMAEARAKGIAAFRDIDQDAAEALSEAASAVKASNKKAADLTIDQIIQQFPSDVEKAWAKLPQSEAGQIRKTIERLTPGTEKPFTTLQINGKPVDVTMSGTPHAVGVLPSDVAEKTLADTMKASGIKSFERMSGVEVTQGELNNMASQITNIAK